MGRIWRGLRLGLKSLMLHKLRSGLTALGLVFGVAAVISMLAVGEGASRDAQMRIEQLGATNIILRSVKPSEELQAAAGRPTIDPQLRPDLRRLRAHPRDRADDQAGAADPRDPQADPQPRPCLRRPRRGHDARLRRVQPPRGRQGPLPRASDDEQYRNYAVLAHATAEALFPYEDPVGETIALGNDSYTVIGVTGERAATAAAGGSLAGQDYNRDVYIPLNTCRRPIRRADRRFPLRARDRRGDPAHADHRSRSTRSTR